MGITGFVGARQSITQLPALGGISHTVLKLNEGAFANAIRYLYRARCMSPYEGDFLFCSTIKNNGTG